MRQALFVFIFFGIQLTFVFLYLGKQEYLIAQTYDKQKNEHNLEHLAKEKEKLLLQLEQCKEPASIKKFAYNKLGMRQMKLNDIRKLPDVI